MRYYSKAENNMAKLSTKSLVPVCRQLATAYEAGIPITQAISHVGRQSKDKNVQRVLNTIARDLSGGATLADAAARQSGSLSPFLIQLLASGETSGKLDVMLTDLAGYYEDRLTMQRSIVSALIYPCFLLTAAWFIGTFTYGIINVALGALDGSGGGVQGVQEYVGIYLRFQVRALTLFAFLAVMALLFSKLGLLRWATGIVSTFIWPFSTVTRKFGMARFFRSFSLMLSSGLNVIPAIKKSAEVTGNPYIERDLLRAIPRVRSGATLVEAFAESRLMTPLAREMLAIGEESGRLDDQLNKAAQYHFNEANETLKRAVQILTYMMMTGIFILVGALVVYFWAKLYGGMMDGLGI
jgi:type IV pilus assembly protein PilC